MSLQNLLELAAGNLLVDGVGEDPEGRSGVADAKRTLGQPRDALNLGAHLRDFLVAEALLAAGRRRWGDAKPLQRLPRMGLGDAEPLGATAGQPAAQACEIMDYSRRSSAARASSSSSGMTPAYTSSSTAVLDQPPHRRTSGRLTPACNHIVAAAWRRSCGVSSDSFG